MASIVKKVKKGRPYYYAVQSQRVDGKPRITWQKYLGTIDAIIERAEAARPPRPKETVIFEAGGVAALLRIAQRLGVAGLIDAVAPKRRQGPTVGHYMLLAALNRALAPRSKVEIGPWYESTVLRRVWGFDKSAFSSQRFWDHMDRLSQDDIDAVQDALVPRIQKEFGLDGGVLLYDTTNFFTFLATTNDRSRLARRGHSKQKRHDLRQIGLALLVADPFQIPLFHQTYPGDVPDVSLFPQIGRELLARYRKAASQKNVHATLVFDKGNVCDDAMETLVVDRTPFVAALAANRCPQLLATPLDQLQALADLPGCRAASATETFWGADCRAVVVYTESFFTQQLNGVTQNLVRCQKKLRDQVLALDKWRAGKGRGKKPTVAGLRKSVQRILAPQFMKELITVEIKPDPDTAIPRLTYRVDHAALQRLTDQRLGRTVLVAHRLDADPTTIIRIYRQLTAIEDTFKAMKNVDFLRWQPGWHWTDQKLRVHGFYCVLALQLASLARQVAQQSAAVDLSLHALLAELVAIREVAVIYPPGTMARPRDHITLSRMTPRQRKLADALEIGKILHHGG
jgi:transposase